LLPHEDDASGEPIFFRLKTRNLQATQSRGAILWLAIARDRAFLYLVAASAEASNQVLRDALSSQAQVESVHLQPGDPVNGQKPTQRRWYLLDE
jgi:hypothetical protein